MSTLFKVNNWVGPFNSWSPSLKTLGARDHPPPWSTPLLVYKLQAIALQIITADSPKLKSNICVAVQFNSKVDNNRLKLARKRSTTTVYIFCWQCNESTVSGSPADWLHSYDCQRDCGSTLTRTYRRRRFDNERLGSKRRHHQRDWWRECDTHLPAHRLTDTHYLARSTRINHPSLQRPLPSDSRPNCVLPGLLITPKSLRPRVVPLSRVLLLSDAITMTPADTLDKYYISPSTRERHHYNSTVVNRFNHYSIQMAAELWRYRLYRTCKHQSTDRPFGHWSEMSAVMWYKD